MRVNNHHFDVIFHPDSWEVTGLGSKTYSWEDTIISHHSVDNPLDGSHFFVEEDVDDSSWSHEALIEVVDDLAVGVDFTGDAVEEMAPR